MVVKYQPEKCSCCGQTKTYVLAIDHGTVDIVKAVSVAIGRKGINCIHPRKEMEVSTATYFDNVRNGKLTSNQVGNLSRARFHGLIARIKNNPGNYCLTKKGAAFLRGEAIAKFAIISKAEKKQIGYWMPETYTCMVGDFKHEVEYWQGINYDIVGGIIVLDVPKEKPKQATFNLFSNAISY